MRVRTLSPSLLALSLLLAPRALAQTGEDEILGGSADEATLQAPEPAEARDEPEVFDEEGDDFEEDEEDLDDEADDAEEEDWSLELDDEPRPARRIDLLDQRWGDAADGRVERAHAWGSFGFFGGRARGGDALVIAPSMGLRLSFTDELDVSASWVLGYAVTRVRGTFSGGDRPEAYDADEERIEAGNPTLTFSWAPRWSEVALRIGVGFALPVAALAQAPTDVDTAIARAASEVVHGALLAMHGGRDPWRFLPERVAFLLPARIAFGGERVAGAIDVAGGVTLPVLGGSGDTEGVLQVGGDIAVAILPELRAGLRGTISAWGLGGAREAFQPSIEPWLRWTLGPAFATVRGTVTLGGESGFGSHDGEVWAIHVGGGAAIEREP